MHYVVLDLLFQLISYLVFIYKFQILKQTILQKFETLFILSYIIQLIMN
jgi:hypothetical protein